uniref:Histone deacetylase complex subunit SAP18 n=1 Tax=Strigamia maritima TaxID=126957 RepID=T1ISM3_STRMM
MTRRTIHSEIVEEKPVPLAPIDREKTCPLLLRVFCNTGRHHNVSEYGRGNVPANELQIYTWKDATLKELMSLVKDVNPGARRRGTAFDFALVFPDVYGSNYNMRDVGRTCSGDKSRDDSKTLAAIKFKIGDFLDVAVTPPSNGPPIRRRMRPY